jgi:hypothetical protein
LTPPPSTQELLYRLDERTKAMADDLLDLKNGAKNYVTKAEFTPIRSLVFGAVAIILIAVLGALVNLVGIPPHN